MEKLKYWKESAGKINITTVPGDFRVAICAEESHARRIVAAVNACEGIDTEILAALPLNFKQHAIEFDRIKAQNARLLEALKDYENHISTLYPWALSEPLNSIHAKARAAIAEAENTEPPHTRATII